MFLLRWDQFVAMGEGPTRVMSGQRSQLTASHTSIRTESLNWEQIEGCLRRNDLAESRVKASKVALWCMLFRMLRGDDPTLNHVELCAARAKAANVASG